MRSRPLISADWCLTLHFCHQGGSRASVSRRHHMIGPKTRGEIQSVCLVTLCFLFIVVWRWQHLVSLSTGACGHPLWPTLMVYSNLWQQIEENLENYGKNPQSYYWGNNTNSHLEFWSTLNVCCVVYVLTFPLTWSCFINISAVIDCGL